MNRMPKPRATGPHLRRKWTARALRRMTRDLDGAASGHGPRPAFWVAIPGPIGLSEGVANLPDCYDIGERSEPAQKVLGALGLLDEHGYLADPRYTKNVCLGVKRGRWHLSGYFYDRQQRALTHGEELHGFNEGLADLAGLINKVQTVTGRCAAVGGIKDKDEQRPAKRLTPFWRAHQLFTMVRHRENAAWARAQVHQLHIDDVWWVAFHSYAIVHAHHE